MKWLLGVFAVFFVSSLWGQDHPVELVSSIQSTCDKSSDPYRLKPRIISIENLADTLDLKIGFAATCCIEYNPIIAFKSDTLFIDYERPEDQSECECICCYSFHHQIKGIPKSDIVVKLHGKIIEQSNEKYYTYPVEYHISKGDTINFKDKYGQKQGLWIKSTTFYSFYANDIILKWGHLYGSGKIKDVYDLFIKKYRAYYESGRLKKECHIEYGEYSNCREWKKNGLEIKE